IPLNPDGLKVFSHSFYHGLQKLVFLWLSKSFRMHHYLMLAIYRGYPHHSPGSLHCPTKESLSAWESVSLCFSTKYRTACSIFCCFLFNSPRVPLHSLEALDPSLHPSTANISLPINPSLLQIKSTSRNNSMIASLLEDMKSAIVVKCG